MVYERLKNGKGYINLQFFLMGYNFVVSTILVTKSYSSEH